MGFCCYIIEANMAQHYNQSAKGYKHHVADNLTSYFPSPPQEEEMFPQKSAEPAGEYTDVNW